MEESVGVVERENVEKRFNLDVRRTVEKSGGVDERVVCLKNDDVLRVGVDEYKGPCDRVASEYMSIVSTLLSVECNVK